MAVSLRRFLGLILIMMASIALAALVSGCQPAAPTEVAALPTHTLAPLVTLTPRVTATPVITNTPIPTFTHTPSRTPIPPTPSHTFTPTVPPPVIGIISSLQTVNIRIGPGGSFSAFEALTPGTGVEVLGTNELGTWLNVRLDDGQEGWVFAELVRIEPTPTVFPTFTPTVDGTALALGTPLPTAVIGGGTVTATPPRSAVTATPVDPVALAATATEALRLTGTPVPSDTPDLPVIDTTAINLTATALIAGLGTPTATAAAPTAVPTLGADATSTTQAAPTTGSPAPPSTTPVPGGGSVRQGVDVLAYCDDPDFSHLAPPVGLGAGTSLDVYWSWFARSEALLQDHIDHAQYEVRVNGELLENWRDYQREVIQKAGGTYWVYWYVPTGPLPAGEVTISYRVTWDEAISDGYADFGPGTDTPEETGSCTMVLR